MFVPVYRVQLVRVGRQPLEDRTARDPASVAELARRYMDGADREVFVVLALDTKNRLIGMHTAGIGTLDAALVHPREIFKFALLLNAASIIAVHNHPSGDTTPSQDDKSVTDRLVASGRILGVEVLDHVVIGDSHLSLKEYGWMP